MVFRFNYGFIYIHVSCLKNLGSLSNKPQIQFSETSFEDFANIGVSSLLFQSKLGS